MSSCITLLYNNFYRRFLRVLCVTSLTLFVKLFRKIANFGYQNKIFSIVKEHIM